MRTPAAWFRGPRPSPVGPRPLARRMTRLGLALGVSAMLVATFSLYLRPGLALDLGQLLALCGVR